MDWIREHLVLLYGIGIGILILAGAVLVSDKFATSSRSNGESWGTLGGVGRPADLNYEGSTLKSPQGEKSFTIADLYKNLESNPDRYYASFNTNGGGGSSLTGSTTGEGFLEFDPGSIDALLASMKPSSSFNATENDGSDLGNIYSYIPSSIMGTTTYSDKPKTALQAALYEYGNEAGGSIETYFSLWGASQSQIFKNFVEDFHNEEKAYQAQGVAEGLIEVGESLERMEIIPKAIGSAHAKLAASYKTIGKNLVAVTKATDEDTLLSAMETYNASVDQFARNYLVIVTTLSANNVTYRDFEPGHVFVFTPIQTDESSSF